MKGKVAHIDVAASCTFTVDQALGDTLNYHAVDPISHILIIAEHPDGGLFVRSSRMDRQHANWMIDRAKHYNLVDQQAMDDEARQ